MSRAFDIPSISLGIALGTELGIALRTQLGIDPGIELGSSARIGLSLKQGTRPGAVA